MSIKIIQLNDFNEIQNSLIRIRAEQCKCDFSIQYLAVFGNEEAGFMSFDNKSHIGVGVIYEIYVLGGYRKKGIANQLLEVGEKLGAKNGCEKIVVHPKPFDGTISKDILVSWYSNHGYEWSPSDTGEMEKHIDNILITY